LNARLSPDGKSAGGRASPSVTGAPSSREGMTGGGAVRRVLHLGADIGDAAVEAARAAVAADAESSRAHSSRTSRGESFVSDSGGEGFDTSVVDEVLESFVVTGGEGGSGGGTFSMNGGGAGSGTSGGIARAMRKSGSSPKLSTPSLFSALQDESAAASSAASSASSSFLKSLSAGRSSGGNAPPCVPLHSGGSGVSSDARFEENFAFPVARRASEGDESGSDAEADEDVTGRTAATAASAEARAAAVGAASVDIPPELKRFEVLRIARIAARAKSDASSVSGSGAPVAPIRTSYCVHCGIKFIRFIRSRRHCASCGISLCTDCSCYALSPGAVGGGSREAKVAATAALVAISNLRGQHQNSGLKPLRLCRPCLSLRAGRVLRNMPNAPFETFGSAGGMAEDVLCWLDAVMCADIGEVSVRLRAGADAAAAEASEGLTALHLAVAFRGNALHSTDLVLRTVSGKWDLFLRSDTTPQLLARAALFGFGGGVQPLTARSDSIASGRVSPAGFNPPPPFRESSGFLERSSSFRIVQDTATLSTLPFTDLYALQWVRTRDAAKEFMIDSNRSSFSNDTAVDKTSLPASPAPMLNSSRSPFIPFLSFVRDSSFGATRRFFPLS
jgi:hypothetical protein